MTGPVRTGPWAAGRALAGLVIIADRSGGRCARCRNETRAGEHLIMTGLRGAFDHSTRGWVHYPSCDDYLGRPDDLAEPREPLCRGCWNHHREGRCAMDAREAHTERVAAVMGESAELDPELRRSADAWMGLAACRDQPIETFYPDGDGRTANRTLAAAYKQARRICYGCPVRTRCLEWALAHNEQDGVWGGLTPSQRRGLRLTTKRTG